MAMAALSRHSLDFNGFEAAESHIPMADSSCVELAMEGERLCKVGDFIRGIEFFEAALKEGSEEQKTLSAVYSQMGNAHFYMQNYAEALVYHQHDLDITKRAGDRLGESKACGNLGNTHKVMGEFEKASHWCERHLELSRELGDQVGEARALYNLGNVFHTRGKQAGAIANQEPGGFPPNIKQFLEKGAEYYQSNLVLVREMGDRASQGRVFGNLGNTFYLLGNFTSAINFHNERLAVAQEFGDKAAERRAYSNLGNSHIFLAEFDAAVGCYRSALQLAQQMNNLALEAQACYSLGNTYTLLRDYRRAVEYHLMHLRIAMELQDHVGEGRAYWSLSNAYTFLGEQDDAVLYAKKHLEISKKINDPAGIAIATSNMEDLRSIIGITRGDNMSLTDTSMYSEASSVASGDSLRPARQRRISMEQMDLLKLTPEAKAAHKQRMAGAAITKPPRASKAAKAGSDAITKATSLATPQEPASILDDDDFFDLLTRSQSRRFDDQRCALRVLDNAQTSATTTIANDKSAEKLFDMVAGVQKSRIDDQRVKMPSNSTSSSTATNNPPAGSGRSGDPSAQDHTLDDKFFDQLMRAQAMRIEDQRSNLPRLPPAPTVPDEDFFSLIQRIQSNRLDEQRTSLPKLMSAKTKEAAATAEASAAKAQEEETSSTSSSLRLFKSKKKSKKEKK